jgi:hypothetical protein
MMSDPSNSTERHPCNGPAVTLASAIVIDAGVAG